MDAFALSVEGWHDFYMMIGTAAATLTGLLFVSLSLNADVIFHKSNADLRVLAKQAFSGFIGVLMFAVIFLIPDQGPMGLGVPLVGIDAAMLYLTTRRFLGVRRHRSHRWGRGLIILRFAIPLLCFMTLMVVAILVLLGRTGGLYWLVPVMIMLLFEASLNAWDLLLRLREPARRS
jgi:hypothetical protein